MKRKKQNVYLFVDGSNLYAGQYELFGPDKYLNFPEFIKAVEKSLGVKFSKIYFYASYSPQPKKLTKKQKLYLKNEALFYRSVKKTRKTTFFRGYRSKTSGKEKEVDVKLAVDMVDFAHLKKHDKIFIISGDADFMGALHVVKRLKIPASVLCLENKIMFKALLFYPTFILLFKRKEVRIAKIRKKPVYIKIDRRKVVKQI